MSKFIGLLSTAEIALSAATAKTVLQIKAPTNQRVGLLAWGVYFDGVSATGEPVQVRLLRQTTAGTMSALTPVKNDDSNGDSLQTTAQHTATVEPTAGDVLKAIEVHPQSGYEEACPFAQEYIVGAGDRIGIECTAPAAVNVRAWMRFEE